MLLKTGGQKWTPNLDSGLSEISIVFQAAVPKLVASKYTTSGVRRYCQKLWMGLAQAASFLMPSTKGTPLMTSTIN